MNLSKKILENLKILPEPKQIEIFDFIKYLNQKTEKELSKSWSDLSIASAMRGMEYEDSSYTINDLKEIY